MVYDALRPGRAFAPDAVPFEASAPCGPQVAELAPVPTEARVERLMLRPELLPSHAAFVHPDTAGSTSGAPAHGVRFRTSRTHPMRKPGRHRHPHPDRYRGSASGPHRCRGTVAGSRRRRRSRGRASVNRLHRPPTSCSSTKGQGKRTMPSSILRGGGRSRGTRALGRRSSAGSGPAGAPSRPRCAPVGPSPHRVIRYVEDRLRAWIISSAPRAPAPTTCRPAEVGGVPPPATGGIDQPAGGASSPSTTAGDSDVSTACVPDTSTSVGIPVAVVQITW